MVLVCVSDEPVIGRLETILSVPPPAAAPPQAASAMLAIMTTEKTDSNFFDISPPKLMGLASYVDIKPDKVVWGRVTSFGLPICTWNRILASAHYRQCPTKPQILPGLARRRFELAHGVLCGPPR